MLQRVAECCSVLQCVAVFCSLIKNLIKEFVQKNLEAEDLEVLLHCSVLQCIAVCVAACFIFFITFFKEFVPKDFEVEDLEMCCSAMQCVAGCCSVLQCV